MRGRETAAPRAKTATLTTLKRDLGKEKTGYLDRQKLIDYAGPTHRMSGRCGIPV
jgi:hypothetical protein